jgi:hypothetical protein
LASRHGEDETPRGIKNIIGADHEEKVFCRPRHRWEEQTKTNLRELGCGDIK